MSWWLCSDSFLPSCINSLGELFIQTTYYNFFTIFSWSRGYILIKWYFNLVGLIVACHLLADLSSQSCLFVAFDSHHSNYCFQQVEELLKQRDSIHSSFTVSRSVSFPGMGHFSNGSSSKLGEDYKSESPGDEGSSDSKDKSSKKKWFNLNLKGSDKKWTVLGVTATSFLRFEACSCIHVFRHGSFSFYIRLALYYLVELHIILEDGPIIAGLSYYCCKMLEKNVCN